MILSLKKDRWIICDSLLEALELDRNHQEILSLTGGGGKTTTIRRLQKECMEQNIFHGVSTTTHMQYEKKESFLGIPSLESFLEIYQRCGTVWMGEPVSQRKMKGFPQEFYRQVISSGAWLLLEADGAKCLPVKAPEIHEPVILPETTRVIQVYGLDGVGKKIGETCFRSQKVAEILGKKEYDLLIETDLALLAASVQGGRKLVEDRPYSVILNKADTWQQVRRAVKAGEKMRECGIQHVYITSGLMEEDWMKPKQMELSGRESFGKQAEKGK